MLTQLHSVLMHAGMAKELKLGVPCYSLRDNMHRASSARLKDVSTETSTVSGGFTLVQVKPFLYAAAPKHNAYLLLKFEHAEHCPPVLAT